MLTTQREFDALGAVAGPAADAPADPVACRWSLKRNCSVYPQQFLMGSGGLLAICISVAFYFWLRGFWVVCLFCGGEMISIVAASVCYARHARDGEIVSLLRDGRLVIQVDDGLRHTEHVFNPNWARLVRQDTPADSLWLHYGSVRLRLARHVAPERRAAFEAEIRRAIRNAAAAPQPAPGLQPH